VIDINEVTHHEAGHAVIARVFGHLIDTAVIISADGTADGIAGNVRHAPPENLDELENPHLQVRLEEAAMIELAGCAAQIHYLGYPADRTRVQEGAIEDFRSASGLLRALTWDDKKLHDAWWRLLDLRVQRLVTINWEAIHYVASCLLERRSMTGNEIDECVADSALPPELRGKAFSLSERLEILKRAAASRHER
jgi:hypothetical protein